MDKLDNGRILPAVDIAIDAKSLFDALAAADVCNPAEASLKMHLIAIRDRIDSGVLRTLAWTDTRDMLADCLTKGGIERDSIQRVMNQGIVKVQEAVKLHSAKVTRKYDPH